MSAIDTVRPSKLRRDFVRIAPGTLNEHDLTVEAVIASETPVDEIDYERLEIVPRVLTVEGAEWPASGQVPLLDSHDRKSLRSAIGSIRNIRREGTQIVGTLFFDESEAALWGKVKRGHITDLSAGFRVLSETYVPAGDRRMIEGRAWLGPKNIATRWRLFEGSLVVLGADASAKIRSESARTANRFDLDADILGPAEVQFVVPQADLDNDTFRKRLAACGRFIGGRGPYWLAQDVRDVLCFWGGRGPTTPWVRRFEERIAREAEA